MAHLFRLFVTGLLAALPLAATVAIFWWAAAILIRWLGPHSGFGGVMVSIGLGVSGSEVVGYLIGITLVVVAILLLGVLVQTGLHWGAARVMSAVVRRIPVVSTVYDLAHKLVGLLRQRDAEGPKTMSAVWCRFGGPAAEGRGNDDGGAMVLALLASPEVLQLQGGRYLAVLVPTAPVPVGGGLLFVPESWVTPAQMGVEAVTSIYISMGVTAPQHLGALAARTAQTPSASKAA
jgi:uncharacterized membrane protein